MSRSFVIYSKTKRPKNLDYPKMTGEYVDYEIHDKLKRYGEDPEDFEIEQVVVEVRTNIAKFINSFKDDVGVENLLRKAATAQDWNILNQSPEIYADTTIIPDDPEEALKAANSVQETFEKLDPELTEGKSIDDFARGLTVEKLDSYIKKQVEKKLKALKEKEVKNNESDK